MQVSFGASNSRTPPHSCDTFVVLPPGTLHDTIIFGKNSDRPGDEVQEVVYIPATDHPQRSKIKCTYIEIDQVPHTYAVVLSKPSWMWGAEMGANEHSVCIGNEAVWTTLNDDSDAIEKLLGMDLLRLGLERGKTALEALNVIVALIEKYGMGGNCSDTLPNFTYHNSFLIADPDEAWILECAGTIWAAEHIIQGVRNISNELSIRTNIDLKSNNIESFAKEKGFWKPSQGDFDFKKAFDVDDFDSPRYTAGKRLLINYSKDGTFAATDMFKVLRDKPSGICMSRGSFISTGSQVSVLHKANAGQPSCHWFTATPDPARSIYKPFIFGENVKFPSDVVSPITREGNLPCLKSGSVDRRHKLFRLHEEFCIRKDNSTLKKQMKELESKYVNHVDDVISQYELKKVFAGQLFYVAVEEESNLYCNVSK